MSRPATLGALLGLGLSTLGGLAYRAFLPDLFYAQTQPSIGSVYYQNNWRAIVTTGDPLGQLTTIADYQVIRTDDALYIARPVQHTGRLNPLGNVSYTGNFLYGQDVRIVPVEEARPILEAHKQYLQEAVRENKFQVVSPLHAPPTDVAVRSPNIVDTYVSQIKFYTFMNEKLPRIEIYGTENPLRVGQTASSLAERDLQAFAALEKNGGLKGPNEFAEFCRGNQVGFFKWPIMPMHWLITGGTAAFMAAGAGVGMIGAIRNRRSR